jgi:hypothetical protein
MRAEASIASAPPYSKLLMMWTTRVRAGRDGDDLAPLPREARFGEQRPVARCERRAGRGDVDHRVQVLLVAHEALVLAHAHDDVEVAVRRDVDA